MRWAICSLLLLPCLGCRSLGDDEQSIDGPDLYVLKLAEGGSCWASCSELSGRLPAELSAGVGSICAEAQSCGFAAGADMIRVVADYGTLSFVSPPATPQLTLTVAGAFVAPDVVSTFLSGPRAHFQLTTRAPATPGYLDLHVAGGDGYGAGITGGRLSILPLEVDACVVCPTSTGISCETSCDLLASTGNASFSVSAPPGLYPPAAMLQSALDLVPLTETANLELALLDGRLQGTAALQIPDLNDSNDIGFWEISAIVGGQTFPDIKATLTAPKPIVVPPAGCACDGSCALTPGTNYQFLVSVAASIRFDSATLSHALEGAPDSAPVSAPLDQGEAAVIVTSPDTVGKWVLRGRVGPYRSDVCTITVSDG